MEYMHIFLFIIGILTIITATPTRNKKCVDLSETGTSTFVDLTKNAPATGTSDEDYAYDDDPVAEPESQLNKSNDSAGPGVIKCPPESSYCYALWTIDKNGTNKIVRQGCWSALDKKQTCETNQCISQTTAKHKFCCCYGNLCNSNFTNIIDPEFAESVISSSILPPFAESQSIWYGPTVYICITIMIITLIILTTYLPCHRGMKSPAELAPLSPYEGPGYSSNLYNVDNLNLISMIGRGKYGTVWKGMVNEQPVAVKIFSSHQKQYFQNERDIYTLPMMDSPSLLTYFGCDERHTMEDNVEYLLVLSLAPLGCLQDFLVENTTSFNVFCKMAKSVARGLSHLHTEMRKGDIIKPCVCHRDLNSRNILVKADLSCCICDLGFSLKTFGSRYEYRGEMTLAETKSINEVGTIRYMAPEVLEGAVNLRDCESALKQIDVYSLGLVLWELCTRCYELYPSEQAVPIYKTAYEEEIGTHPSFEDMQVLVSRRKARPLFLPCWGGQTAAAKIARETCEDCWDHDAEARLTALCVEERLQEMSTLSPNINRCTSPPLSTKNLIVPITSPTSSNNPIPNGVSVTVSIDSNQGHSSSISSPSSATSVESTANVKSYKNRDINQKQLQPYQGRNLCLERNLAPQNPASNQQLVERSSKHSTDIAAEFLEDDVFVEEYLTRTIITSPTSTQQHSMGEGFPKKNNFEPVIKTGKSGKGWNEVRSMIQKTLFSRDGNFSSLNNEEGDIGDHKQHNLNKLNRNVHVNLIDEFNSAENGFKSNTTLFTAAVIPTRPNNLDLSTNNNHNINQNTHKQIVNSAGNKNNFKLYKKPPGDNTNQKFTVINSSSPRIVVSKSANAVKNLNSNSRESIIDDRQLKRQRSLEVFRDVFGPKGSVERLRDPSQRVKTPGDVPPSVRKVRASKTLSLYDDRMMDPSGNPI